MAAWKTDPLIRLVFEEIRALWEAPPSEDRPVLFRVEERASAVGELAPTGRLVNVWLFDEHGIRLAPVLRRELHDFGESRAGYSRFGLVRFHVTADRSQVALEYQLGPRISGELAYDVVGEDDELVLKSLSGTLSA